MKYLSPVIVISQLLLVTSLVQAHHQHNQGYNRRRFVDDGSLDAREDILQSLTTRELVEELSARLERRTHHHGLGAVLDVAGNFFPPAKAASVGLNVVEGLTGGKI